eukprot:jgi/Ulvmu1/6666/UM003_0304.1
MLKSKNTVADGVRLRLGTGTQRKAKTSNRASPPPQVAQPASSQPDHRSKPARANDRRQQGRSERKSKSENIPAEGGRASAGGGRGDRGRKNSRRQGTGGGQRWEHDADFIVSRSPSDANHLLGFRFHEELPAHAPGQAGRGGGRRHRGRGGWHRTAPPPRRPFKKDNFLQASYRFVVSDAVDAARHAGDADAMFDWEDVLQVEVSQVGELQCPITLEAPPTVPVVTACGHIFSLPAIVHCMLDAGGENFTRAASCPLCFNPISARDLRLVSVRTVAPPPAAGERVSLVLLRRARDSILPDAVAAPAAPSLQPAADARTHAADARTHAALPLSTHPFAKFVEVNSALPTMRAAAAELARYAVVIVAGGGVEAAVEGPSLFKSMDLLAAQARAWTQRRLDQQSAGGVVGATEEDTGGFAAGLEAERAVRDVFEIQMADERTRAARAAEAEEESRRAAQRAEVQDELFPQLGGPGAVVGARLSGRWGAAVGGSAGGSERGSPRDAAESDLAGGLQFDLDDGETPETPELVKRGDSAARGAEGVADGAASPGIGSLEESMRLLGTSPNTGLSVNQIDQGDFYMYQAADGQWLFLHPINIRAMLNHYKGFHGFPRMLEAEVVEVETLAQTAATRRALQPMSHVPLTAEFRLVEVDLAPLLPAEALAPFKDELAARAARRARERARAKRDAARAAAAAAAAEKTRKFDMSELGPMPLPHEAGMAQEELQEAAALQVAYDAAAREAAAAAGGPSYATLARLGLAAPTGPVVGSADASPSLAATGTSPGARGAWGPRAGMPAAAAVPPAAPMGAWGSRRLTQPAPAAAEEADAAADTQAGRRNKKGQKVVLLTRGW